MIDSGVSIFAEDGKAVCHVFELKVLNSPNIAANGVVRI